MNSETEQNTRVSPLREISNSVSEWYNNFSLLNLKNLLQENQVPVIWMITRPKWLAMLP